jgi:hypothetical protein
MVSTIIYATEPSDWHYINASGWRFPVHYRAFNRYWWSVSLFTPQNLRIGALLMLMVSTIIYATQLRTDATLMLVIGTIIYAAELLCWRYTDVNASLFPS